MSDTAMQFAAANWHLIAVAFLIVAGALDFSLRFGVRSFKLGRELRGAIAALHAIRKRLAGGDAVDLGEMEAAFARGPVLPHLWREYKKTLHAQRREDELGQSQVARWRATAMAESFLTEQSIVDSRLKTEYFKHLPGLLTGLGIIGTFLGLIRGLGNFQVSGKAEEAKGHLEALVSTVGEAFYVSAVAIFLAMLVTALEKAAVSTRYRQVEELRELIDGMFTGGAGEEYLERLAASSENAATQSAQIKDALVADLKEILTTLAKEQMEAQARSAGLVSASVGSAIAEGLSDPMREVAAAVKSMGSDQGDAVNKMLTDVLASFASQMREMFGSQMQGLGDLMLKAGEAMQSSAEQFGRLAADMDKAGSATVDAMGERMAKALEAMDARQAGVNAQMEAFVGQIRAMVEESQTESSQKLKDTLSEVGGQVAGVVEQLRRQAEAAAASQGERQERLEQATGNAVGSLSGQVERLLAQSMETNESLRASVSGLAQATDKAISGMNSGAEKLLVASTSFARAGEGVSETMRTASVAGEAIKQASSQLTGATEQARGILSEHARTRDAFALMVDQLKATVEAGKRDASMTSEIVGRLEAAAKQLSEAERLSERYLQGVNEVLGKAHESFRENVERTLREGNGAFQAELAGAVQLLGGAIKNLGDLLDDIPARS